MAASPLQLQKINRTDYNTTKEIADEDEKAIKCDYLYRNGLISDELSTAIQENVYNSDNFDKS